MASNNAFLQLQRHLFSCTALVFVLVLLVNSVYSGPVELRRTASNEHEASFKMIRKRSPSVSDRPGCQANAPIPPNRQNTTERLINLRKQMILFNVDAYIVTSDNAHQSEMVSPHDHRREFISGFTGSAGTAVISANLAAVWTDGRYYIQAENQLDCNWILMKQSDVGVPTIAQWLQEVLETNEIVAADPTLIGTNTWLNYQEQLDPIQFKPLATNLIDEIWNESNGRPPQNDQPAYVLPLEFSGEKWQDKVDRLRTELPKLNVDALVITALDEVAWLLNIRGLDVPNEPVVLSYMYVSADKIVLFADSNKIGTPEMQSHLNGIEQRPYNHFVANLTELSASASNVLIPSAYIYTGGSSFAVYNAIPSIKRELKTSPVLMMKAKKNQVEAKGMMNASLKDSVALCDFLSLMAEEVPKGVKWTELKVAKVLQEYRDQQNHSKGASFETIAGFGPNGAIIHYAPSVETDATIDTTSLFLLDSGGQYFDGTTDVTRTLHFGTPTEEQKEAYTLVLMGHVDLARIVVPRTVKDTRIDALARAPLYNKGLDFLHGTGHGVGSFLSVHESPTYVGIGGSVENRFEENYFFSDEPGYYKEGFFGIRIESILRAVSVTVDTEFRDRFYRFEPATLVPFERKLIAVDMLSTEQIDYINQYYSTIRANVGLELQKQNRDKGYAWLMQQTEPLTKSNQNAANLIKPMYTTILFQVLIGFFTLYNWLLIDIV